jgi:hypothetical protein
MSKKKIIIAATILVIFIVAYKFFFNPSKNEADVFVEVKQGEFEINVF